MRMIRFGRIGLCVAAALVLACGCDTIGRARKAQAEVAPVGLDEPSATGEVKRVDLKGLRLVDYVAWAMNHRPNIEAAHLAVSNAVLELARVIVSHPHASTSAATAHNPVLPKEIMRIL